MEDTQNKFLDLMQTVLDEIKSPADDHNAHSLNSCLSRLTEAYQVYIEVIHRSSYKNLR
ncbi:hypothetical protein NKE68_04165 [Streptococcus suis]|uniref:hypothetical protein n=1 Tax=Streptococcus suis TaxID=1307 RepID=UPI00209B3112|nr:hypothetical protein [Streptococcus suis]MCO8241140.1 hypothetical protein [Streptococcus suis]